MPENKPSNEQLADADSNTDTPHDKETGRHQNESKKKLCSTHRLRCIEIILTGILVAVGIAYSVFAALQWYAMRGQIAMMDKTLRIDQRAWLSPRNIRLAEPLSAGKSPIIHMEITNGGKTPATNIQMLAQIFLGPPDSRVVTWNPNETIPSPDPFIGPGRKLAVSVSLRQSNIANAEAIKSIEDDKACLFFICEVRYSDAFGEPHKTQFCVKYCKENIQSGEVAASYSHSISD